MQVNHKKASRPLSKTTPLIVRHVSIGRPDHPIAHAITLGILGIVISTLGLIAIITQDLAPAWYGWALIVFSVPVTWLGGKLAVRSRGLAKS